ncbi:MAG: hypothetical protein KUL80_07530 [Comamonas sp.]|nr:hypothetical protein [Comamonas sp.]
MIELMVFTIVGVVSVPLLLLTFREHRLLKQQRLLMEQARQEQYARKKLELDTAIADWLRLLELPQLTEQSRRQEVASQLGTVLIEKLLI